jgi:glycosyltransferase involved in cell wall biosynthesis
MAGASRIAVLAADSRREADGIRDYSHRLVRGLREMPGVEAEMFVRRPGEGWCSDVPVGWGPEDSGAAVVQYNPFWYGRRGFAPGLVRDLRQLRRSPGRPAIALMVHETYVKMSGLRWTLMGAWQRAQMVALRAVSDVQFCSIERWVDRLRAWPGATAVHHLPVPSNFPDRRGERLAGRAELGVPDDAFVLTCFGLRHPGRLVGHVVAAAEAVASHGRPAFVLNLGSGEPQVERPAPGVTIDSPGYLPDGDAARLLAASDLFLAPYADGVSTRRTTMMAALQHALPVLGTDGHLTDHMLRDLPGAMRLVPVGDMEGFAAEAARLSQSADERRALGDSGRAAYASRFDWPVVVSALLGRLPNGRAA